MNPVATLSEAFHLKQESNYFDLDLSDAVASASKVIAPLGPLNAFAARHPWQGLEYQSFDKTARWFKETCDVAIYPNKHLLLSASEQGEIDENLLEDVLKKWLDAQSLELSRDTAERFCRKALRLDIPPVSQQTDLPELSIMAKKLNRFTYQFSEAQAVKTYSQRLEQLGKINLAQELNRHMIKWCKLYLDESQAVWSLPNRKNGFYQVWRNLIGHDPALKAAIRKQLKNLPDQSEPALKIALLNLGIPFSEVQSYLEAHLLALPGWAGMMLWRSQQSPKESSLLTEYLAVRISLEQAVVKPYLPLKMKEEHVPLEPLLAAWYHWGDMPIDQWSQLSAPEIKARLTLAYRFDEILRNQLWLEAWEKTYEAHLMKRVTASRQTTVTKEKPALAQFVFCIDVRSEPFRRKLEKAGPFETFGTAGFFGLPIETCELGSQHSHPSLPVMFKPQYKVRESASESEFSRYQQRNSAVHSLGRTFKTLKHNLLTSLVLPELSGPWLSLQTLGRTFVPRQAGQSFRRIRQAWLRKPATKLTLDNTPNMETELPVGFSLDEKIRYARQALKMMGLTENFVPLVVICGHGSHSTNNPYAASLDCGACGGASSGFNARVLAALCNLPEVREALAAEGINIPCETIFTAAEHITTVDELRWLYVPALSSAAQMAFARIQAALPKVSDASCAERIVKLPGLRVNGKNPKLEAERLAEDWSEIRPEWGLARNAAFVIGSRELTKECDLEGRVFLHNYHWQKDRSGTLLANIISGPATVAQWINLQYYASTVAPHYYGSGNKATQTVTAGIGVMQGNASDLLAGLPWQSVMLSDEQFYHAPLRLLIVIEAPSEYIERLLHQDHEFRQKLRNSWIRLASIDPKGSWKSWS
ncbi:Na-translocating system protein MpsB [Neobacillus sp. OS1-32]|uniref:Probable inorganic carbon transporter subunit DabA n=1 Tax=Neobacillus paridis TaxID=2803862 RepID=A0ABS1TQF8_9BACI|nr:MULTISPECIES: putative inorganic carbon transporter subunit DabA [Neobacillus]MBL4953560.1 DUF2309 family protein [Neobacillus paridis]WML32293.1 Na-translocating system protein MpsB [Neobacillus sp. OS1-32]